MNKILYIFLIISLTTCSNKEIDEINLIVKKLNKLNYYENFVGYQIIPREPQEVYLFNVEFLDLSIAGFYHSHNDFKVKESIVNYIDTVLTSKNIIEIDKCKEQLFLKAANFITFMIENNIHSINGFQYNFNQKFIAISLNNGCELRFVGDRSDKENTCPNNEFSELLDSNWVYCKTSFN